MLLYSKKRLLHLKKIPSIRTLVKYSAIAFCLSNHRVSSVSSFSLDSPSLTTPIKFDSKVLLPRTPFLIHRGGSVSVNTRNTSSLKMSSSTSTDAPTSSSVPSTAGDKLEALRAKMKELDLDAYIVPSDDPHLSEYVPEAYMRRKFLTSFGGSAGTALVLGDSALLWTDSRYDILFTYKNCSVCVKIWDNFGYRSMDVFQCTHSHL